jgi:molybdopterin converting factor small subunit
VGTAAAADTPERFAMKFWKVMFFARARDLARRDAVEVGLFPPATAGALKEQVALLIPELAELAAKSALSVNGEFAADDRMLPEGAEIALLPPVSGG